jgi:Zn finger protein HypA/HybF involved in hydrogenase expression
MYSTNGRKSTSTENASENKTVKNILICKDCNATMSKSKEFGENTVCDSCGSSNVEYQIK